jgi:hypothetical protein
MEGGRRIPSHFILRLIDEYVREEALYREAIAPGLNADDYIIKLYRGWGHSSLPIGD